MTGTSTRPPAVAGQFYPREPDRLRNTVARYIEASGVAPEPERTLAILVPHAGYVYSGPTAGFAYARIRGKHPARVVLLGASHRYHIHTASICTAGAFDTPLGSFPIDEAFAKELAARIDAGPPEPHQLEHSLEVQLPFIEAAIGLVPIVPVLFGALRPEWLAEAGRSIAELLSPEDLVVASTDLSHYLTEEEANEIDRRSVNAVLEGEWRTLAEGVGCDRYSMCGAAAVIAALALAEARGATERRLLDYRTSAHASGDYDRVVGYAAIAMERPA